MSDLIFSNRRVECALVKQDLLGLHVTADCALFRIVLAAGHARMPPAFATAGMLE